MMVRLWLIGAAFGLLAMDGAATIVNAQAAERDLPIAIVCERGARATYGYLSEIKEDGSALYQSMDRRRSVIVTADGIVEPTTGMAPGNTCFGKSIDDLRKDGKTIEAVR